jgi:hypothetical protein
LLFAKYLPVIAIAEVKSIFKITRAGKPAAAFISEQEYDTDRGWEIAMANPKAHHAHDNDHLNLADPRAQGGGEHQ